MKKSIQIRSLVTILFISFINSSCIKGVDFEQAESIILKPITEFSLIYTSLDAPDFLYEFGLEFPSITDSVILEVLSDDFLNEYLIRADLVIEVTNSLNKDFEIQMEFYDNSNALQHTFPVLIENSVSNSPIILEHIEVFTDSSLEALKASNRLDFKLSLLSSPTGSVLTNSSLGAILFKSKVIFYFEITE